MKKDSYTGTIIAYLNKNTQESIIIKKIISNGYNVNIYNKENLDIIDIKIKIMGIFYDNNPDLFIIENDDTNKGNKLFMLLLEENLLDNVPVLFIGHENQKEQINVLKMGAIDYITDFSKEETYFKIINFLNLGKKLSTVISRDRITGVYTKKSGENIIRKSIAIANEEKEIFSVLALTLDFIDEEKFEKQFIEKVLKSCVNIFKGAIGNKNIIYLYEKYKFVLTFRDKNFQEVLNVSLSITEEINKISKENDIKIKVYGGISGLNSNTIEYETLISHAFEAVEKAKETGDSQVYIYDKFYEEIKEKKILFLEKDEIIRNIIIKRYINKGYEVFDTIDYDEAVEISKKRKIDIVIIAIEVFNLLEKQFIKNLKEASSEIKIILLTSVQNDEVMEKAFRLGVNEYIKKPLSLKELDIDIQKQIGWW